MTVLISLHIRYILQFLFLSTLLNVLIFATYLQAQPPWKDTHIPSEAGGDQGILVLRNGENWIGKAVQNIPQLMFIVEASETDHVPLVIYKT